MRGYSSKRIIASMLVGILVCSQEVSVFAEETDVFAVQENIDGSAEIVEQNESIESSSEANESKDIEPIEEIHQEEVQIIEKEETSVDTTITEPKMTPVLDSSSFVEQTLTAKSGSAFITVKGLMPQGTTLYVAKIYQLNYADLEEQINQSGKLEGNLGDIDLDFLKFEVEKAYDITLYNADGTEYQPQEYGLSVDVQIVDKTLNGLNDNPSLYRVDEIIEEVTKIDIDTQTESSISFETDHFTQYVVGTVTYDTSKLSVTKSVTHRGITWTLYNNGLCVGTGDGSANYLRNDTDTTYYTVPLLFGQTYALKIKYVILDCNLYKGENSCLFASSFYVSDSTLPWSSKVLYNIAYNDDVPICIYDNWLNNLDYVSTGPNFKSSASTNYYGFFGSCANLKAVAINKTIEGTSYKAMFRGCTSLQSLDISGFNTSNVTDMSYMFNGCSALQNLNLSNFNTSKVTNMRSMFNGCSALQNLNLSNFSTSKVTNMSYMFYRCSALQNLNLSNFNTSNVTDMSYMFANCSALQNLNLSNFNTSKVTNMYAMFANCSVLQSLDLSNFNTSRVTNMKAMFENCPVLQSLDLSNFKTSNVTNMSYMFNKCCALLNLDLSNFNTSNVTDMSYMFNRCYNVQVLDVSTFNTSKVTNMSYMFSRCYNVQVIDVRNFNTSKVTNMYYMFNCCYKLQDLDVSNFNTIAVTNMYCMFSECFLLETLDLSSFYTDSITDIEGLFSMKHDFEDNYAVHPTSAESKLKKVLMPNFVLNADVNVKRVFECCDNLQYLQAPKTIAENLEIELPKKESTKWYLDDKAPFYAADTEETYTSCINGITNTVHTYIRDDITGFQFSKVRFQSGTAVNNLILTLPNIASVTSVAMKPVDDISAIQNGINVATISSCPIYAKTESLLTYDNTKTSHTVSIDNEGTWVADYNNSTAKKDTVTIPGASSLHIKLKYGTQQDHDYVYVFKGKYEGSITQDMQDSQIATYTGNAQTPIVEEFEIEGDTVTFGFYSDDQGVGYGYFAEVSDANKKTITTALNFYIDKNMEVYLNADASNMFENLPLLKSIDLSRVSAKDTINVIDMLNSGSIEYIKAPKEIQSNIYIALPMKLNTKWYIDDVHPINRADSTTTYTVMLSDSASHTYMRNDYANFLEYTEANYAKLCKGSVFVNTMFTLAGNDLETINSIIFVEDPIIKDTNGNVLKNLTASSYKKSDVSIDGFSVYMCFDKTDSTNKIIYIYPAEKGLPIYANEDCSYMFCKQSVGPDGQANTIKKQNLTKCTYLDATWFDTRYTTNFQDMFFRCKSLKTIDVSHFDTSKGTNFKGMFARCGGLVSLDLTNFDTSKGTTFREMFYWCGEAMQTLNISGFDFSNGTDFDYMFDFCDAMKTLVAPKTIPAGANIKMPTFESNRTTKGHSKTPAGNKNLNTKNAQWYLDDLSPKKMSDDNIIYPALIDGVVNTPHTYIRDDMLGDFQYTVTIPAQIQLEQQGLVEDKTAVAYRGTYKVSVSGKLNDNEYIEIKPAQSFSIEGKEHNKVASVTLQQPITKWKMVKSGESDETVALVNEETEGIVETVLTVPDEYEGRVIFNFVCKEEETE